MTVYMKTSLKSFWWVGSVIKVPAHVLEEGWLD